MPVNTKRHATSFLQLFKSWNVDKCRFFCQEKLLLCELILILCTLESIGSSYSLCRLFWCNYSICIQSCYSVEYFHWTVPVYESEYITGALGNVLLTIRIQSFKLFFFRNVNQNYLLIEFGVVNSQAWEQFVIICDLNYIGKDSLQLASWDNIKNPICALTSKYLLI